MNFIDIFIFIWIYKLKLGSLSDFCQWRAVGTSLARTATAAIRRSQPTEWSDFLPAPKGTQRHSASGMGTKPFFRIVALCTNKGKARARNKCLYGPDSVCGWMGTPGLRDCGSPGVRAPGFTVRVRHAASLSSRSRCNCCANNGRENVASGAADDTYNVHGDCSHSKEIYFWQLLLLLAGPKGVESRVESRCFAPPFANSICVYISGRRHVWCWQKFSHFGKMLARNENCRVRQNADGMKGMAVRYRVEWMRMKVWSPARCSGQSGTACTGDISH